jgi:adenylate cyclase, class 2
MQNIEFKSELRNLAAARCQCQVLGAKHGGLLQQTDTYFRMADGRLKKREMPGEPAQWILYHRPDRIVPRMSNYTILNNEQARRRWGTHGLKQWLVVRKRRDLWLLGDVRIHLDDVENLGCFIEFEALVSRRFDVQMCQRSVAELREVFAPLLGEPISRSYCDLLEQSLAEKR